MAEGHPWRPVAFRRRFLLVILVLTQTFAGLWLFAQSLPDQVNDWMGVALTGVFGVLFAWIGVGFWTAVLGFVTLRRGGDPHSLCQRYNIEDETTPLPPTAVVMPICHEPVERTLAGLQAIYRALAGQQETDAIDFYLLSDSRDPEIWLKEQAACNEIQRQLGAHHRLFYRRRRVNLNHKSGNIADFLRRWGRRYRYMVVLDADSLLSGRCITRLIRLMENRPQAGIIQTAPRLARAQTRFARLQQFANRCYGRLYGAGLAAIQLGEATYWGHNAIIRVAPFMRHCGLRKMKGRGLFSGPVLSHDFVEAALIGRGGYEVWLEPAIAGSYEESPPTLKDDLIRDRRWCRGNLQHLWLLATLRKLTLAHRMALVTGILSYLASPLWLVFLGLSGYVAFNSEASVLPGVLAGADTGTGMLLAVVTGALLFGPRLFAITDQLLAGRAGQYGGIGRLATSTLCETLIALVLAPIRMVVHTVYVLRALGNRAVGWQGQNRTQQASLKTDVGHFAIAFGVVSLVLGLIHWYAPDLTPWSLPAVLPILLAPLLTRWLDRCSGKSAWLPVPEDQQTPPVVARANARLTSDRAWPTLSWVEELVLSPARVGSSQNSGRAITGKKRDTLRSLIERCAEDGPSTLSHREMSLICSHPAALEALHLRAWQAHPGSPWGKALARLAQSLASDSLTDLQPLPQRAEESLWIDAVS